MLIILLYWSYFISIPNLFIQTFHTFFWHFFSMPYICELEKVLCHNHSVMVTNCKIFIFTYYLYNGWVATHTITLICKLVCVVIMDVIPLPLIIPVVILKHTTTCYLLLLTKWSNLLAISFFLLNSMSEKLVLIILDKKDLSTCLLLVVM